jgi:CelD/BcsL family acetyltransferase involved in cellulose biosynthesis
VSILALAGYYWPFRAPLIVPDHADESARAMVEWTRSHLPSIPWRCGPVPRGTPAIESLINAFTSIGWSVMEKRVGETYAVTLNDGFAAYEQGIRALSKKMTYYERRLRRSGNVETWTGTRGSAIVQRRVLQDLETIEARSWVSARAIGKPKFIGDRNRAFWNRLLAAREAVETLRPMILYLDDRPISYSLNLDAGNTRYIVANGYDEEFSIHSPGMLLAYQVLRDAAHTGKSVIEWGLGDSGYKSRWGATENLRLVDLLLLPGTARGYLEMQLVKRAAGYARVG